MRTITAALALLLLTAPLAAQEPADTARATAELAISFEPGSIVVRGDTTFVFVSADFDGDSLAAAVDRASLALQMAILSSSQAGAGSGPPGWAYGGALLVAAGFVLAYAYKEEARYTFINDNDQSQTQTVEVVETTRWPWCWPPGHCKRKHGNEDDDDE